MYGSPRSCVTDRQGLTWQETFFKRVISLSTVRWFFSLLIEQWWRERFSDGLVTELRVMQVPKHHVAGLLLEEDFSGLWVLEIVEEVGLVTCESGVIGQRARLLSWRSAQGIFASMTSTWKRKWYKSRFRQKKKRQEKHTEENKVRNKERTNDLSGARHMDEMTRTSTWANVVSHIIQHAHCVREKVTCEVYCLHGRHPGNQEKRCQRRLQEDVHSMAPARREQVPSHWDELQLVGRNWAWTEAEEVLWNKTWLVADEPLHSEVRDSGTHAWAQRVHGWPTSTIHQEQLPQERACLNQRVIQTTI